MQFLSLFIARLSVALFSLFLIAAGVHAQPSSGNPWTAADRNAAVDAAADAASRVDSRFRLRAALDLASVLQNRATPSRASDIIDGTAAAIAADPVHSINGGLVRSVVTGREAVEELAEAGASKAAEAVVGAAVRPSYRASLLGSLGVGRARAGDIAGAENAVTEILSLATADGASGRQIPEPLIARTGVALALSGAPAAAARLAAGGLPDGSAKAGVFAQIAGAFCDPKGGSAADPERGRQLAGQAGEMAKAAAHGSPVARQQRMFIALAAVARARCDGADAALAFVRESLSPEQAKLSLGLIADQLAARGDVGLARAFTGAAVAPAATDPRSLVDAAQRFLRDQDRDAARTAALQAAEQINATAAPARFDYFKLRGELFAILVDLGEHDQAIAVVALDEPQRKRKLFVSALERAIRRGDAGAVSRLAPEAIAAVMQPQPDWQLCWLARILAVAGYRDDARMAYQRLTDAEAHGALRIDLVELADLQALLGDIPAALATTDRAGLSPATPGRKPRALQAIAMQLAEQGNIDGALQVQAKLAAEPQNPLGDTTLLSIAVAQARSRDLRGAYTTSLRIADPYVRLQSLLHVVAAAPGQ